MATTYLVVDMRRVLDQTACGRQGAAAVEARFRAAQDEHRRLRGLASTATGPQKDKLLRETDAFEARALREVEDQRTALRNALLERARPIMDDLLRAAGTTLLLDRSAVVACDPAADITDRVMTGVDAAGPLGAG